MRGGDGDKMKSAREDQRKASFKKGIDDEAARSHRQASTVQIRKQKREKALVKRRGPIMMALDEDRKKEINELIIIAALLGNDYEFVADSRHDDTTVGNDNVNDQFGIIDSRWKNASPENNMLDEEFIKLKYYYLNFKTTINIYL